MSDNVLLAALTLLFVVPGCTRANPLFGASDTEGTGGEDTSSTAGVSGPGMSTSRGQTGPGDTLPGTTSPGTTSPGTTGKPEETTGHSTSGPVMTSGPEETGVVTDSWPGTTAWTGSGSGETGGTTGMPGCNPLDPEACGAMQTCIVDGSDTRCARRGNIDPGAACDPTNVTGCAPGSGCFNYGGCGGGSACCAGYCSIPEPNCPKPLTCQPLEVGLIDHPFVGICIP